MPDWLKWFLTVQGALLANFVLLLCSFALYYIWLSPDLSALVYAWNSETLIIILALLAFIILFFFIKQTRWLSFGLAAVAVPIFIKVILSLNTLSAKADWKMEPLYGGMTNSKIEAFIWINESQTVSIQKPFGIFDFDSIEVAFKKGMLGMHYYTGEYRIKESQNCTEAQSNFKQRCFSKVTAKNYGVENHPSKHILKEGSLFYVCKILKQQHFIAPELYISLIKRIRT